jgi:hypothetical protein
MARARRKLVVLRGGMIPKPLSGKGRLLIPFIGLLSLLMIATPSSAINYNLFAFWKSTANFGTGIDGPLTVNSTGTIVNNVETYVTDASVASGANSFNVNSTAGFAVGKEILIIQMQTSTSPAGIYEFRVITAISANKITVNFPMTYTYVSGAVNTTAPTAAVTQVIQVPNYTTVTINAGGSITANAWNGSTGGIVVFRAQGTVTVTGSITVSGIGFRGGNAGSTVSCGAMPIQTSQGGESWPGVSAISTSVNGGGGGGGNSGQCGVTPPGSGAGGAYGGLSSSGWSSGNTQSGSSAQANGGQCLAQILLGSGGGGGGSHDTQPGTNGGAGGGIIMIYGNRMNVTGSINSNGNNSSNAISPGSGGGGGSGGSILLTSNNITLGANLVTAAGGSGGTGAVAGGSGSMGRIRVESPLVSGTSNPPFSSGANITSYASGVLDTGMYVTDASLSAGAKSLHVDAIWVVPGDTILILQMQGGTFPGTYEQQTVASISGNTISFLPGLQNSYVSGNPGVAAPNASVTQVLRVSKYLGNITVPSGATVSPNPWQGKSGGVVAMQAGGNITVTGTITTTGYGFTGGLPGGTLYCGSMPTQTSNSGESYNGLGSLTPNPNDGAGGGGNSGQCAISCPGGGAGASHSTLGGAGANYSSTVFGINGNMYGRVDLARVVLGSGGGAGGSHDTQTGAAGGNGGGIIFITGNQVTVTGSISADGGAAGSATSPGGGGGGGSGGSILLSANTATVGTNLISAAAGAYGTGCNNGYAGGLGRVEINAPTVSGSTTPSYANRLGTSYLSGIINNYMYVTDATDTAGSTTLNVDSAMWFMPGDKVLILQTQGGSAPGSYEFKTISSVTGTSVTLSSGLTNSYSSGSPNTAATGGVVTQIVSAPQWSFNVNIPASSTVTPNPWNGKMGGVVTFSTIGNISVAGTLSATGFGFRGKLATNTISCGSMVTVSNYSGESWRGIGATSTSVNDGGGGAGNSGQCAVSAAGAGGGGSYASQGTPPSTNTPPALGGSQGSTYGVSNLAQIYLGSAGGTGGSHDVGTSGIGGSGGGIVYLTGNQINVTGAIAANGGDGTNGTGWGGAGGGGSGGSIYLVGTTSVSLGTNLVTATGGASASSYVGNASGVYSGSGGNGRIQVSSSSVTGTTNP